MTELATSLDQRREEFETHFSVAVALDDRIFAGDDVSIGTIKLSARHLLTMKSGLLVHLYNIVESTMSHATKLIGTAIGTVPPRQWTESTLKEWLREYAVARVDGGEDARLDMVHSFSMRLLTDGPLGEPQQLRKPPGTWTDKSIAKFAQRLGVEFPMTATLGRLLAKRPDLGDDTPLEFLADRRNALAHGRRSFEEGARDLTLAQIRMIADAVFGYLEAAVTAFQGYVNNSRYVVAAQ